MANAGSGAETMYLSSRPHTTVRMWLETRTSCSPLSARVEGIFLHSSTHTIFSRYCGGPISSVSVVAQAIVNTRSRRGIATRFRKDVPCR